MNSDDHDDLHPLRPVGLGDVGNEPSRAPGADQVRTLLVSLVGGVVVGLLGVFAFRGWMRVVVQFVAPGVFLTGVAVAMMLALVIHEAGHVVAGLAAKWRFVFAIVGPLNVSGVDGLRVRRNSNVAFMGGLALVAPTRWEGFETFRKKNLAMIAGGPLASVALAILGVAVVVVVSGGALPRSPRAGLAFFGAAIAVCSGIIAVATLVPSRMGPVSSDGLQLLTLWRSAGGEAAATSALRIAQLHCTWVRPRDWPRVVDHADAPSLKASEQAFLAMVSAVAALDTGGGADARRHTARALRHVKDVRPLHAARVEIPQYEAFAAAVAAVTGTLDEADALLASARTASSVSPAALTMADACLASARGRHDEARGLAQRALAEHAAAPLPVGGAVYMPFVDWIEARAAAA